MSEQPTLLDMNATPIGPLPCSMVNGELKLHPKHNKICKAAGLKWNGSNWAVNPNTLKYFVALKKAVMILAIKNLHDGQYKTYVKEHMFNQEDLILACINETGAVRVRLPNKKLYTATIGKELKDITDMSYSNLAAWLSYQTPQA